jgi:ribosomal protein S18 acetylase RimI-like enzyme
MMDYKIIPAEEIHLSEIVHLHCTYIHGVSGHAENDYEEKILEFYYRELIQRKNSLVNVAVLPDGKVAGYSALTGNHVSVMISLVYKKPFLVFPLMKGIGIYKLLKYVWHKAEHDIMGGKWHGNIEDTYKQSYELRSVAVDPLARGGNVGTSLLTNTIDRARADQLLPIIAWVYENNIPSRGLFEKVGFKIVWVREDRLEKVMLYALES